jgi:biotin--protein ligase
MAIVRACRDERALGAERGARVSLKWPNDVYIDSSSPLVVPGGEKKKVGGVLVNISITDGKADVIIGTSSIIYARFGNLTPSPFFRVRRE